MVSIISGDYEPPSTNLSGEEKKTFDEAFDAFSTLYDMYGQAPLSQILQPYKQTYESAAKLAKAQFKGATFGGLMQSTGFNLQMIRATTILTQTASSQVYDWAQQYTSKGWQSIFGSHSNKFTTGVASTIGTNTAAYTQGRVTLFMTHLLSHTPPLFDEMQFGVGAKEYNVFPTTFERISNVYIMPLPEPIFIPVDGQYYFVANFNRLGTDTTQLLGGQFVLSSYAAEQ